jgi:hypothetical protein
MFYYTSYLKNMWKVHMFVRGKLNFYLQTYYKITIIIISKTYPKILKIVIQSFC